MILNSKSGVSKALERGEGVPDGLHQSSKAVKLKSPLSAREKAARTIAKKEEKK